jgi:hypothetical protein
MRDRAARLAVHQLDLAVFVFVVVDDAGEILDLQFLADLLHDNGAQEIEQLARVETVALLAADGGDSIIEVVEDDALLRKAFGRARVLRLARRLLHRLADHGEKRQEVIRSASVGSLRATSRQWASAAKSLGLRLIALFQIHAVVIAGRLRLLLAAAAAPVLGRGSTRRTQTQPPRQGRASPELSLPDREPRRRLAIDDGAGGQLTGRASFGDHGSAVAGEHRKVAWVEMIRPYGQDQIQKFGPFQAR